MNTVAMVAEKGDVEGPQSRDSHLLRPIYLLLPLDVQFVSD